MSFRTISRRFIRRHIGSAAAAAGVLAALKIRPGICRGLRGLATLGLAVLVAWQAYLSLSIYRFVATHDTPGGLGTPASILVKVATRIEQLGKDTSTRQIVMLCPGSEPRWDECPAVFQFLTSRAPLRLGFMDYDDPLLWSHQEDEDTVLVLAPGPSRAASDLPRFAQELPEARVLLREEAGEYRFFRAHNYYRDLAAHLTEVGQPSDAIILNVAGQRDLFEQAYRGGLPVYELPQQPVDREKTIAQLRELLAGRRRIYGIFRVSETNDPEGIVDSWLSSHAYRTADQWLGPINFVTYATPSTAADWVTRPIAADFDGQLELRNYARTPDAIPAGDMLQLRLSWGVTRQPDTDTVLFAQLLDQADHILAQRDLPWSMMGVCPVTGCRGRGHNPSGHDHPPRTRRRCSPADHRPVRCAHRPTAFDGEY